MSIQIFCAFFNQADFLLSSRPCIWYMVCKYFLPFHELSFHFVDTVIFDAQKFLIFIWLILYIFFHCLCFLVLKKLLSNSTSLKHFPNVFFWEFFYIYIFCWGIVALQCCVGFCVQQNESAVYIYSCIYIDIWIYIDISSLLDLLIHTLIPLL